MKLQIVYRNRFYRGSDHAPYCHKFSSCTCGIESARQFASGGPRFQVVQRVQTSGKMRRADWVAMFVIAWAVVVVIALFYR